MVTRIITIIIIHMATIHTGLTITTDTTVPITIITIHTGMDIMTGITVVIIHIILLITMVHPHVRGTYITEPGMQGHPTHAIVTVQGPIIHVQEL